VPHQGVGYILPFRLASGGPLRRGPSKFRRTGSLLRAGQLGLLGHLVTRINTAKSILAEADGCGMKLCAPLCRLLTKG
jgi:hypothetical protein